MYTTILKAFRLIYPYANDIQYVSSGKNYLNRTGTSEVQDGFDDHRQFFITSILEGQELGHDWARAPLLRYYKHYYPVLFSGVLEDVT